LENGRNREIICNNIRKIFSYFIDEGHGGQEKWRGQRRRRGRGTEKKKEREGRRRKENIKCTSMVLLGHGPQSFLVISVIYNILAIKFDLFLRLYLSIYILLLACTRHCVAL
jgi:hypothetical protein